MLISRNLFASVLCIGIIPCIACLGQTPASFSTVSSAAISEFPISLYAIDVNNDGLSDLIEGTQSSNVSVFTVSLAKGDGSFAAPVTYSFPSYTSSELAFGDFNGDGKVDVVATVANSNQIAIAFGNGNVTFQPPKVFTVAIPTGDSFDGPLVAADFNRDGKMDVVAMTSHNGGGGGAAVVLAGDGKGNLTSKGSIYTFAAGLYPQQLVTGDFDSDNNADVALTTTNQQTTGSVVHVLYGNGSFGFQDTVAYSTPYNLTLSSGDLNGDGRTDVFGYENTYASSGSRLVLLYGQTGKTFDTYYTPVQQNNEHFNVGTLVMADFNGDGRMDLVGLNNPNSGNSQVTVYLAGGSLGMFKPETYTLPHYESQPYIVVGDFNRDGKPDIATVDLVTGSTYNAISIINHTTAGYYGGCAYPKAGQGISVCTPSGASVSNPISFSAAANSFGQIRKFELWVDGKKIADDYHSWGHKAYFDLTTSLAPGSHYATFNVTTVDNDAMDYNLKITVAP